MKNGSIRGDIIGGIVGGSVVGLVLIAVVMLRQAAVDLDSLTGLPDDFAVQSATAFESKPEPFAAVEDDPAAKVLLWEAVRRVESPRKPLGSDYTAGPQETGDCVSWGLAAAIYHTLAAQAVHDGIRSIDDPFQPFLYASARTIRGPPSPPCGSAGAYPTEAVEAFTAWGWATYGECGGVYNGRLADKVGCSGPLKTWRDAAKARTDGDWYPVRSVPEWRQALIAGRACTVAIPWRPGKTYTADGRRCIRFDGPSKGGHQIASIGVDGSKFCLMNSHGVNWPQGAPPMQGEPKGSVWVEEKWAEWIIDNGVVIAVSTVPGFAPVDIDWSRFEARESK